MPEPDRFPTRPARRSGGPSLRTALVLVALVVAGGAVLLGWLAWEGRLAPGLLGGKADRQQVATPAPASPAPLASPSPSTAALEAKIAALETRLARIDTEASTAEAQTRHAQALILAVAARRAVESGRGLNTIAAALRREFGASQGEALKALFAATAKPVTLDRLAADLDALGPMLASAPIEESGWQRFKRELSELFVIRREDSPASRPEDRLERARLLLRTGQIDLAIKQVEHLPGAPSAGDWLDQARRYAAAQAALDKLEAAALAGDTAADGKGR